MILIRTFQPDDYEMISEWFKGHKNRREHMMPLELLPPIGQVAYDDSDNLDLAAMWLYLAQASTICFAEHAITRPKLSVKTASAALLSLTVCLRMLAANLGYQLMVAHCAPGMARYLERVKWDRGQNDLVAMWSPINGEVQCPG
jgi:hypothetical protein